MDQCNTVEELKKVYKKLILKHHPDKGGDAETFNKIHQEYEQRLKDFESGPSSEPLNLEVSLEEAYSGFVRNLRVTTESRCRACSQLCPMCHGAGHIKMNLGFMVMTQNCPICEGRGGSIPSGCDSCKRTGKFVKNEEYTVNFPAGSLPGTRSGRFVLNVKNHHVFELRGADLYMSIKMPFAKSVSGTTFTIKHLNKNLTIDTTQWSPIDPRIHHVVKGEGMPPHGDLHIIFDIQYKQ